MAGKTIFLTGGTGFFGKWLMESFIYANESLSLGMSMIVLSRNPGAFIAKYPHFNKLFISFIAGDIRDFEYPTGPVDYIMHTATDMSGYMDPERGLHVFDSIVEGTRFVLDLAKIKKVKSILHTSSGGVYGR